MMILIESGVSSEIPPFHEGLENPGSRKKTSGPPSSKWPQAVTLTLPSLAFLGKEGGV